MWEANHDAENKPVLVTFAGGPGCTAMSKAFGTYNPIDIDGTNKCIIQNPGSITDRFNLLYIESPVGAGFSSVQNKNFVKKFDTVSKNVVEIIRHLLNTTNMQGLRNQRWYYNGESFCGFQVPKIADDLHKEMDGSNGKLLPHYGGTMIFTPVVHREQCTDYTEHIKMLSSKDMFNDCCEECCCSICLCCGSCCLKCGCMTFKDYEGCWFTPWACFEESEKKNKKTAVWKAAPTNLDWKHCAEDDDFSCRHEIMNMLTSKTFHSLIQSKKIVKEFEDSTSVPILEYDKHFSSNSNINHLINTGRPFLLCTGDGDYIVPWKLLEKQVKKWDIYKHGKLHDQKWIKDSSHVAHKSHDNFEWKRLMGVGHMPFVDQPSLYTDIVRNFLYDSESHFAQPEHAHVHVSHPVQHRVVSHHSPVEVHHSRPHVVQSSHGHHQPSHSHVQNHASPVYVQSQMHSQPQHHVQSIHQGNVVGHGHNQGSHVVSGGHHGGNVQRVGSHSNGNVVRNSSPGRHY